MLLAPANSSVGVARVSFAIPAEKAPTGWSHQRLRFLPGTRCALDHRGPSGDMVRDLVILELEGSTEVQSGSDLSWDAELLISNPAAVRSALKILTARNDFASLQLTCRLEVHAISGIFYVPLAVDVSVQLDPDGNVSSMSKAVSGVVAVVARTAPHTMRTVHSDPAHPPGRRCVDPATR